MSSEIQSVIEQAVRNKDRPSLLQFLQIIIDGLKQVESPTSQVEESTSSLYIELQREVREKAKEYITSRGAKGHASFTKNILESACGEYKTIKDCSEQDLKSILEKLKDADNG